MSWKDDFEKGFDRTYEIVKRKHQEVVYTAGDFLQKIIPYSHHRR